MGEHQRRNGKVVYKIPVPYRIWHSILITVGPFIYLTLSIIPWLGESYFELRLPPISQIRLLEFSSLAKLTKFPKFQFPSFSQEKSYQVDQLKLYIDSRTVELNQNQISGYRSTIIELGNFSLHWTKSQPLILIMPDNSQREFIPTGYNQLDNGFMLQFPEQLQLFFHMVPMSSLGKGSGEESLEIKLLWPLEKALPAKIQLPWGTRSHNGIEYNGRQLQLKGGEVGNNAYFSAMGKLNFTVENYLELPLEYYAILDFLPESSNKLDQQRSPATQVPRQRILSLLWQQNEESASANQTQALYRKLYQSYTDRLLHQMQQHLQTNSKISDAPDAPNAQWVALYLELLLSQKPESNGVNYENERKRMLEIVKANSWGDPNLIPYLGIDRTHLDEYIRTDHERIAQVRNNYYSANWNFNGQIDLANMLFNYGYLKLLLSVAQRALEIKQNDTLSDEQRFYLLGFLWETAATYPLNGIVTREAIKQEFGDLLRQLTTSWQQGFPEGLSVSYVLDVLQVLQKNELGLAEQSQLIAIQLFQLMDAEGNLPKYYSASTRTHKLEETLVEVIPCYKSWPSLGPAPRHPRNTSVVPGFWLWTAGSAKISFVEEDQPIEVIADNFPDAKGNKLLLLRGIYFYPQKITVDGISVPAVSQIPTPRLGQPPSWYYDFENTFLAIELPASSQDTTKLVIQ